ncbi:hypothetical protein MTR_5g016820 [Medicago truncatula]|uniref:Uncharacterized protein n=1 Tax=Medicago truncatula TaxID=3880 RepID=G7K5B4_MEDTR|nr:hypothetical protein MTR_5g016820 [Medicago truncatula]
MEIKHVCSSILGNFDKCCSAGPDLGPGLYQNRILYRSDQLRSSVDPINDFGVINVADPEAWLFQIF